MYKILEINNFRQFKNERILLGKSLTVFAGRNSTGKSTILGLLANSSELKKKYGETYANKAFKAEFSEILKGSRKYDSVGSNKIRIEITDENGNIKDYRDFRTAWQKNGKGKDRFRVIPYKKIANGKKTETKMELPVLYLGLSRLFPLGEADSEKISNRTIKFDNPRDKEWIENYYKRVLSIHDELQDIDGYSIGETEKKKGVGVNTNKYDYLTNSAGQDNVGQILMSLLSFKKLKENISEWRGGLLLIDEIDATLHPAAQKRLIDILIKEVKTLQMQVVVTTHSSDLLKHLCVKTQHNSDDNNVVEMYYLTNERKKIDILRNPSYDYIENDLFIQIRNFSDRKIKVYSEDAESRWLLNNLISEVTPYLDIKNVCMGCSQLLSLIKADLSYFGNTLIVLDGDVKDKDIKKVSLGITKTINNIIKLPGDKRPEELMFDYINSLDAEHPFWEKAYSQGFTWLYFRENGPDSGEYKQAKERERYKKWFLDHLEIFNESELYYYWAKDNKKMVDSFVSDFKKAFNSIAEKNFVKKME